MKKYLNIALAYALAAMAGGVFYREFTKFNHFSGVTVLGKVHAHLFLLGMLVYLLVALYAAHNELGKLRSFRAFLWCHNIGVVLTAAMMNSTVGESEPTGTSVRSPRALTRSCSPLEISDSSARDCP